ncbi:hypothetical protein H2202_011212 [Exophiala xenobiotica]|nr:hypothetical protein H2202_011212 [Exophiala xenobiotica]KAK5188309.1 hypothetical protein LTR92_011612 [Exophiala xenobiotica]KAK5215047.1 hypothetical protein LTR72_011868 [Exophiala xenobiotica]KAK5310510.1 hypothetical protein LTR93_012010 [Exophiala xenobiotica]KAK5463821.1 hypothetical protein LTR55_011784 [Exophiala xenobiotica]
MALIGMCVSPDEVDRDNAKTWFNCIEELVFTDSDLPDDAAFTIECGSDVAGELCAGLPTECAQYIKNSHYDGRPGYKYLRTMLAKFFRQQRFEYDHVFDSTILELKRLELDNQEAIKWCGRVLKRGRHEAVVTYP